MLPIFSFVTTCPLKFGVAGIGLRKSFQTPKVGPLHLQGFFPVALREQDIGDAAIGDLRTGGAKPHCSNLRPSVAP